MRRRLREYQAKIDALIDAGQSDTDWEDVIQEHLVQISFFQHERLIHLLVTLAFALMALTTAAGMLVAVRLKLLPVALAGCVGAYLVPVLLSQIT